VFGTPFSALFAFKFNLGIHGLWWGLMVGISIQFFAYLTILITSDYDKIAAQVHETHIKALEK